MKRYKREMFAKGHTLAQVQGVLDDMAPDGLWATLRGVWFMDRETYGLSHRLATRATWHVFDALAKKDADLDDIEQGIIDLFELRDKVHVVFEDGRDPWGLPHPPIGAPFAELAEALAELLGVGEAKDGGGEPAKPHRENSRSALSKEGQRELVKEYWRDKANGLLDETLLDGRKRMTQEKWAEDHGISDRTLRRYLDSHSDLASERDDVS